MQDSNMVRLVRNGERAREGLRHNTVALRSLRVALLAFAALLFIPAWVLLPGLVFTGLSLLGLRPFQFGSCGPVKTKKVL